MPRRCRHKNALDRRSTAASMAVTTGAEPATGTVAGDAAGDAAGTDAGIAAAGIAAE
jgi:hypothetical protein